MNPRLALVFLLGFIAILVFTGWLVNTRRRRNNELLASQRKQLGELKQAVYDLKSLLSEIQLTAQEGSGVDPSADLILLLIDRAKQLPVRPYLLEDKKESP